MDAPLSTPDFTLDAPGVFHAAHGSAHSWSEDFGGENGQYQNRCVICGTLFLGHKRRLVCKVCYQVGVQKWENMTEEERQEIFVRTRDALAKFYAQNGRVELRGESSE